MLHFDLIPSICDYLTDTNYYFLNKEIYNIVIYLEKDIYWKFKYDNYFAEINKNYLILKGNYNWKREYLRVLKFPFWNVINNKMLLNLSDNKIQEIPKEMINLTNLQWLHLDNNGIKEIPKEISNLINLIRLYLENNEIKEIRGQG